MVHGSNGQDASKILVKHSLHYISPPPASAGRHCIQAVRDSGLRMSFQSSSLATPNEKMGTSEKTEAAFLAYCFQLTKPL